MQDIVSLCKRRGFIFPGSEIYGGLANTYDYGPLGVEMLRNIGDHWWENFVATRSEIYGLDTGILMSPKVWEASGHTASFTDALIDCKECKNRTRADHLIENYLETQGKKEEVEGRSEDELGKMIDAYKIPCPVCNAHNWTEPRNFNLLFETHVGIVPDNQSLTYLRGEIAQGMFVNFKNVLDTMRPKLPFGIAQYGKAFRNEITLGNFIFRMLEFNLAEFEYFFDPATHKWQDLFEAWKNEMESWVTSLGIDKTRLEWREHTDDERAHYSEKTQDLDFKFPFGSKELFGLAYRTDYDLRNHMEKSGIDLRYTNPNTGEKIMPHVVEPTFGINRVFLALLVNGYSQEDERLVLKLHPDIAPYKVAVFPLVKNKEDLVKKAREVYENLVSSGLNVAWDDRGNIGKRYLSQDEIGTPYCVTIDYQTLDDKTVTVRDRDTTEQNRISLLELSAHFAN
jgi:glycyl-tRNA synthetase